MDLFVTFWDTDIDCTILTYHGEKLYTLISLDSIAQYTDVLNTSTYKYSV